MSPQGELDKRVTITDDYVTDFSFFLSFQLYAFLVTPKQDSLFRSDITAVHVVCCLKTVFSISSDRSLCLGILLKSFFT